MLSALPFILAAALWAAPSFLLHNLLHEAAHALVAWWAGCSRIRLVPWPSRLPDGRWSFAHMTYEVRPNSSAARLQWLSLAPVLAEALWWLLAFGTLLWAALGPAGGLHGPLFRHWWAALIAVEAVSPLIDCTTWVLPWWRRSAHRYTDAEAHRRQFGFSRAQGKLWSLLLLPPSLATAGVLLWAAFSSEAAPSP